MTKNLFESQVGVPDLQPLFEVPDWLHVSLSPELSSGGRLLCDTFLRVISLVLQTTPPRRLEAKCSVIGGALSILFDVSPQCRPFEHAVLSNVADAFQELHNRRFAAEVRDGAPPVKEPMIACESEEFDFDALVMQPPGRTRVQVFRFAENAGQTQDRIKGRDGDAGRRIAQTLERLALSGLTRPMAAPPTDWHRRLDDMVRAFPNFADVLETAIYPHVALTATGLQHRLAPILLVGGPGIGKTRFSTALADLLGAPPPLFLSLAGETNSSSLGGSSTFWANSSPGQLFESIAWGRAGHEPVANGLLILDEVDKANRTGYSPLGPLYSLLEEQTARCFVDQSLPDLEFDASHLRVVATCNELAEVPAPLQSRMLVFHINEPADDQLIAIAQQIVSEIAKKMGVQFSADIPSALDDQLKSMSPRTLKLALEIAFARAVLVGRDHLISDDWPSLRSAMLHAPRRRPMGFVAH